MRVALLLLLFASLPSAADKPFDFAQDKPNFVVILIDDLGWTDLGCMGSSFYETPHIDRLAARGMKFTQAYSACTVCSPTRASLLTGKYPARLRVTDWIPGHARPKAKLKVPEWTQHLPLEEITLAEALKEAGYATASIGKWHLGNETHSPEKHGFGFNAGGTNKGQPPSYFSPYKIPTLPDGEKGEYVTDRLAEEAVKFIRENREKPFFVYMPHFAVHTPLQAKPALVEKYKAKAKPGAVHKHAVYAAMIESMDESVGRIVKALEELKLSEKTVVIFTSDNGGLMSSTSNAPLRVGKGSAYEGGVRVPLLVSWPGTIAAGSACDTPVITPDHFPTLLELAGAKPSGPVDGVSLVPLLRGKGTITRDALYWHYPHYHPGGASPYGAIRDGDWRLVEHYEDGRLELFHLKEDIGEKDDLASSKPAKTKELYTKLVDWRKSIGAQMPTPNPDYKGE